MRSPSLLSAPLVADWLDFSEKDIVRIRTGKVELGQGILTALVQVVSQRFGVEPSRIEIVSGVTGKTPNEGYTAGSLSVPHSATALEAACDTCITEFCLRIARKYSVDKDQVWLSAGQFSVPDVADDISLWSIADEFGLDFEIGDAVERPLTNVESADLPRLDLPQKIAGSGLIQDLTADDILHAQILRPPRLGAQLDTSNLLPEDRNTLVIDGSFAAVVDDNLSELHRKAERLGQRLKWNGGVELTAAMLSPEALRHLPAEISEIGKPTKSADDHEVVVATYTRPYLMHASIGCVTALARWGEDGQLKVISQTQGPYQLRSALSALFEIEESAIIVEHAAGAGCYGHNGADDVAGDAALVARHYPGRTVRVSWSRAEEFSHSPLSSAGEVKLEATLGADGHPASMSLDIVSGTHARRPGTAPSGTLLAELQRDGVTKLNDPIELPEMHGYGGLRNAISPYSIPSQYAKLNLVDPPGLRTSALRGLGTYLNVFSIESFMDELAVRAGIDPLDYRLSLLEDPRARDVLSRAAESSSWDKRPEGGTGEGWGLAYSRYKDRAAYVAIVAHVSISETVRLNEIWCIADAGRVVSMDGVRNQIEGGIIQAASWALLEEVRLTDLGTLPLTWDDYPIMRFPDIPKIDLEIVDSPDKIPLGAGEVAVGPTVGAIANAVAHGLGVRLRNLPYTRDKVMAALLEGDGARPDMNGS